jgi:hypothetical protein
MTAAEAAAMQGPQVLEIVTNRVSDDIGVSWLIQDAFYQCATGDTALYGILTVEGALDFAASATATIYLYVEKN